MGKPVIAYDFEQMDVVLAKVTAVASKYISKPLGVKLAPLFDMRHFQAAADVINKYPEVKFVTTTNTMGNGLVVDYENECAAIAPKNGFGGLAGSLIKYTALANVKQLRERLREDIDVVGVGGVASGVDAFELLLCGASAVQVGTRHWKEPSVLIALHQSLRKL